MNLPLWDVCKNFHRGNPQSVKANEIAHKYKIPARNRIIECLQDHEIVLREGMTCEQIETETGLSHQTCSARLSELKNPNQPGGAKIKVVGERMTRSGSPAAVYQAI